MFIINLLTNWFYFGVTIPNMVSILTLYIYILLIIIIIIIIWSTEDDNILRTM